jgi:hypothetical protein
MYQKRYSSILAKKIRVDLKSFKRSLTKKIRVDLKSFKRSLTKTGERKTIEDLRLNVDGKRAELKEACTVGKWGDNSSKIEEKYHLLKQLYPNMDAPSDHPPVAASVNFFLPT